MTTEEEIAAVLAVLSVIQAPTTPAEPEKRPEWSAPARLHRRSSATPFIHRGWVTSSLPH